MGKLDEAFRGFAIELLKKQEAREIRESFGISNDDAANNYLPSQKEVDDYLKSMGKKDKKEPEVACPECGKVAPISVDKCPACGADF